jgi:NAD(P)-dependent dehydrogenase (short-subunit alcohol dehydrogenase family)
MSAPVAIITGASQGIGAGLVAAYRHAGYAVIGVARSFPRLDDDEFVAVAGDVADAETARRAVGEARDRFGRIDTLINNAGVYIEKPFTEYTVGDFRAITAVNLTGFFHFTRLAIKQMAEQGSGHVVNISTSLVDHADSKRPAALSALTKGGLVAATRSLAIEYASHGVRVNAVSLGIIRTSSQDDASYAGLGVLHPLGRVGEVSDVVDAILYLERAGFVTAKRSTWTVARQPGASGWGFDGQDGWGTSARESTATPRSAAASAAKAPTAWRVLTSTRSPNSVSPSATLTTGSKAVLLASVAASARVFRASWLNVIET